MSMSDKKRYSGKCFCGCVEFTLSGEPIVMGYCHCESCRHWSAGPINAFTLWKPDALEITKGEDNIGIYNKTKKSFRKWCKTCGGHLFTQHPAFGLIDVYKALLPNISFNPTVHVNYQETVLHIKDGLVKMKDMPKDMGGSGIAISE